MKISSHSERMKLVGGDGRNLYEHIVAWLESKALLSRYDELCHLRWQQNYVLHKRFRATTEQLQVPISADHFDSQENKRSNEPFPVVCAVNDKQHIVDNVETMRPVKYLLLF